MRARALIVLVALACAVALVVYTSMSADGYPRIRELRLELHRLEQEQAEIQARITRMQRELEALQAGGKYRQKVIRDQLGYIRDDEIIVDLSEDTGP